MIRSVAVFTACLALCASFAAAKPQPVPLNKVVAWNSGKAQSYTAGDLTLTFRPESKKGETAAVLTVAKANGPAVSYPFSGGFDKPSAQFAVGRFDPKDAALEVLLGSYSGGAHCCLERRVFVLSAGKWKVLEIHAGENAADLELPLDANGDGVPDFVLFDDRFAYTFGCFACSWLPPRIFNVQNGAVADVSASRRYDAIFRDDMAKAEAACLGEDKDKGICAGVAADGARLGEFPSAWRWLMEHYPRDDQWGYPDGCKIQPREGQECPPAQKITFDNYPAALAWFLKRNGYITPAEERWAVKEGKL